jgi:hypothetical protein
VGGEEGGGVGGKGGGGGWGEMTQALYAHMNNKTISKKHPSQKRSGGVSQGVGLSSNPSTTKKKFFNVCMVVKIKNSNFFW